MPPARTTRVVLTCLDLLHAAALAVVFFVLLRQQSLFVTTATSLLCLLYVASAAGAWLPHAGWSRRLQLLPALASLALTVALLVLLGASAGYVSAAFGGVGRLASAAFVVLGVLVLDLFGLYPAAKLYVLLRPRVSSAPPQLPL